MRYFFLGLVAGCLLAFVHIIEPSGGMSLYPEWWGEVGNPSSIEQSGAQGLAPGRLFPVQSGSEVFLLAGNGTLQRQYKAADPLLLAVSGNGQYCAEFEKAGRNVEFISTAGDRFWRLKSLEYPYLSFSGRLVLLLNGDQSKVRIFDYNGNGIGAGSVMGRFCTVISFAQRSDFAGIGFIDGSYYLLNQKGEIVDKGKTPQNTVVKGMAVSDSGNYYAVHFGNAEKDRVRLVNVRAKDVNECALSNVHMTRTAMNVADDGTLAVLDRDRLVFTDDDADVDRIIKLPPARAGHAKIARADGLCAVTYSPETGGARFILMQNDGNILFTKDVPEESFLDCVIDGGAILLRGSQKLLAYRYFTPKRG